MKVTNIAFNPFNDEVIFETNPVVTRDVIDLAAASLGVHQQFELVKSSLSMGAEVAEKFTTKAGAQKLVSALEEAYKTVQKDKNEAEEKLSTLEARLRAAAGL